MKKRYLIFFRLILFHFYSEKDIDAILMNVSSVVGYVVSSSIVYSATKFYVSSFTEALYHSLKNVKPKIKIKILAPALTETEFFSVMRNDPNLTISDLGVSQYHTPE